MITGILIVLGLFFIGLWLFSQQIKLEQQPWATVIPLRRPGWVYFLSPKGGAWEDPPAPIKVGMTHRDPALERLPEIETMSPEPLEILHIIRSEVPEALEAEIHHELVQFRRHGEWFDRDATLAWLDDYFTRSA